MNHLVVAYEIREIAAETDADIIRFTQLSNKLRTENVEAQRNKVCLYSQVYYEFVLNGSFIEGLLESIHRRKRYLRGSEKSTTVHDLARHATSLRKIQRVAQYGHDACKRKA